MPGRAHTRLAPLVLVLAAALSACGGDAGTDDLPATSQSSPSASADRESVTVEVTREGDSFTPNGARVELGVDQTLVLAIDADEAGELHVHSTPEQEVSYEEGASEHEITIDRPGVVEVESHDPDVIVMQLEVR